MTPWPASYVFSSLLAGILLVATPACTSDTGAPSDGTTEGTKPARSGPGNGTGNGQGGTNPVPTTTSTSTTNSPPDAGTDAASSAKKLTEACTADAECESGVCFKGTQASYCSLRCTTANAIEVCVAPFNGQCNNQGYCRRP